LKFTLKQHCAFAASYIPSDVIEEMPQEPPEIMMYCGACARVGHGGMPEPVVVVFVDDAVELHVVEALPVD